MADPPRSSDTETATGDDTGVRPERESLPGAPRWVKVSGIIVIALVLLLVILVLTGVHSGAPGPGGH
jgi:hypothetical protein